MSESVLCERAGGVATLIINRPEVRNALNVEALAALRVWLAELAADDSVRVVVLTGAGTEAFCSGMDLEETVEPEADRSLIASVIEELYALGKPTIAKVRGYALAGGMGLALSCDQVFADKSAVFGLPEIHVGLWPYIISVPLLRTLTPKVALDLMMTGRRIKIDEALRIGAVQRLSVANELDNDVANYAAELAKRPAEAMQLGRTAFYTLLDDHLKEDLAYLVNQLDHALTTGDAKEGIAAFREKRDPNWN